MAGCVIWLTWYHIIKCHLGDNVCVWQWHALDRSEQAKYYEMARKEKELHMQMYPGWSARDNYATHTKKKKLKPHQHQQPASSSSSSSSQHRLQSLDPADVTTNGDCGSVLVLSLLWYCMTIIIKNDYQKRLSLSSLFQDRDEDIDVLWLRLVLRLVRAVMGKSKLRFKLWFEPFLRFDLVCKDSVRSIRDLIWNLRDLIWKKLNRGKSQE